MTMREAANQPELTLLLDNSDDDDMTKVMKMMIKQMVRVQPCNRLSADEILLQLYKVRLQTDKKFPTFKCLQALYQNLRSAHWALMHPFLSIPPQVI